MQSNFIALFVNEDIRQKKDRAKGAVFEELIKEWNRWRLLLAVDVTGDAGDLEFLLGAADLELHMLADFLAK